MRKDVVYGWERYWNKLDITVLGVLDKRPKRLFIDLT